MKLLLGMRALVRWVSLALLALLVITPLAQIVMRGIFNVPMAGAEELARYFLIAMTFLAASYVTVAGVSNRTTGAGAVVNSAATTASGLATESFD